MRNTRVTDGEKDARRKLTEWLDTTERLLKTERDPGKLAELRACRDRIVERLQSRATPPSK